jgi:hypothetical protein
MPSSACRRRLVDVGAWRNAWLYSISALRTFLDELGREGEDMPKQRSLDHYYLDCAKKTLEKLNRTEPVSWNMRGAVYSLDRHSML